MKKILVLALCLLAVFAFASCGKEDEEKNGTKGIVVKFETYTDMLVSAQVVENGGKLKEPTEIPERAGYTFLGWYNGEKKWDFNSDTVTTEGIVLTAKWDWYLTVIPITDENGKETNEMQVVGCDFDVEHAVIPETYNGKRITRIHWAFAENKRLKSVVIPNTVVSISESAFASCKSLESIVIPKSVTTIKEGAFEFCNNLKTIYCEAEAMPSGWNINFNKTDAEVIFGYKK